MRYIHFSGVIHRDLKPSNILLNEKGHPLISDFGSSRFEADDATPTRQDSTVHYAAPEQCLEDAALTSKVDVFTFGLLLYELLVHYPVFPQSNTPFDVIRCLRNRDLPAVPTHCGSVMQNLIPRCWLPDPGKRPSFDEILSDFRSCQFNILPNADSTEIDDFYQAIVEWERRDGIFQ
jgi:serine/threonine protein kinase